MHKNTLRILCIAATVLLIVLVAIGICLYFPKEIESVSSTSAPSRAEIAVHFIDVGQGDAAIIQTPDGNIIIDAGNPDSRNTLISYIDGLEINGFAYAIFSHPHVDHIGGAAKVLQKYDVQTVVLPNAVNNVYTFEKMQEAIAAENCSVLIGKAGDSFSLGAVQVDLLAPVYEDERLNNMSIVAKVTYGEVSFLFAADAEFESESAMLMTNEAALDSDVLKVGHHGSSSSSSVEFLEAVSPAVAIVPCGYNNDYGHPHREIVQRMREMEIPMFVLHETGSISFFTDGTTYEMKTEK